MSPDPVGFRDAQARFPKRHDAARERVCDNGAWEDSVTQASTTDATDALIGRAVAGKYVIERLLGRGAMASVYRARQIALEKDVAIKVMHPELKANPAFGVRFHREAKAASRLDHPNSIRVMDYGESGGLLYIVMEYCDGRDLFTVLHEEALEPTRIVDMLSQA